MRRLTLGVMGHVDHGKTALVRALTGMETDRLEEERRRGVSIVAGFAHARFGSAEVDFIDLPGHERFVRAMVAGAAGVDAALLVVAANEGVKPQTREHLEIAAFLGVARVLPVIAKADLADVPRAEAVAAEVADALAERGLPAEPPVRVSLSWPGSLLELGERLGALAHAAEPPADNGWPYLPVDRAFTVAGRGTVVTGTLRRGVLGPDTPLVLSPGGQPLKLRGLQVHGAPAPLARPGQRVALNLRGVEPGDVPRGSAVAGPGVLHPSRWLDVELRAAPGGAALRTGTALALLAGTAELPCRLRLLEDDALEPGACAFAQLELAEPWAVPARERFVLRRPSPAATVAGGRVLDPLSRRRRRRDRAVLAALAALAGAGAEEALRLALDEAGQAGAELERLQARAGLGPGRLDAALQSAGARRLAGGLTLGRAASEALQRAVLETLAAGVETQPNGVALRRLAALLPAASAPALAAATAALAAEGRVRLEAGVARLPPGKGEAQARAEAEAAQAAGLARRLRAAGLDAPDLAALSATPADRRALERLVKTGEAVRTLDRVQKRELVFHRDALLAARERLRPRLAPPGLTVGEAGALLGVSRRFSVPLLEHLDAIRFTRRQGDRRTLGPAGREPPPEPETEPEPK